MWVRGLKHLKASHSQLLKVSHPMWVRGLKLSLCRENIPRAPSHPMWVRGLKLENRVTSGNALRVAPYVGAWIETVVEVGSVSRLTVAPYVGAWIETTLRALLRLTDLSHPMWVRGLKLVLRIKICL